MFYEIKLEFILRTIIGLLYHSKIKRISYIRRLRRRYIHKKIGRKVTHFPMFSSNIPGKLFNKHLHETVPHIFL